MSLYEDLMKVKDANRMEEARHGSGAPVLYAVCQELERMQKRLAASERSLEEVVKLQDHLMERLALLDNLSDNEIIGVKTTES